jgi:hypothetical protein
MFAIRFLSVFAIFFLVDYYFYQSLLTLGKSWSAPKRKKIRLIYWGITAFTMLLAVAGAITYKSPILPRIVSLYVFCLLMILFISKLIGSLPLILEDVVRLFRLMLSFFRKGMKPEKPGKGITRGRFISQAALGLAALPFSTMLYGMVKTAFDTRVKRVKIPMPNLPDSFNGLKIIQISDIHSGSFMSDAHFRNAVSLIMAEKPDLIVFTGDLVNDRAAEAEPFREVWKGLSAPLGVFSVLGNHDYGDYAVWDSDEAKQQNLERLFAIHGEMGWNLMRNEHRILQRGEDKIALVGVENWGSALRFPKKGDVGKAREGMPEVPVQILLSHDPSHWESKILPEHSNIDLMLSGHTHGFQFGIEIPGFKWSPSQYVYPQWAGHYTRNNQHLYVNRGLGFLGYLGRIGINPEITLLELHKG